MKLRWMRSAAEALKAMSDNSIPCPQARMDIRCCPHNGHVEVTLPPLRRLCDVERDNSVPMLGAGQSVLLWAPSSCARVDTLYTVDHENRPRLAHQPLSFFAEA